MDEILFEEYDYRSLCRISGKISSIAYSTLEFVTLFA